MTHRTSLFLALTLSALALTGCHRRARQAQPTVVTTAGGTQTVTVSHRHFQNLVRTAARDMRCREQELAPQEVSPGIFAISGCGQLRDYVMVCTSPRRCRWVGIEPVERVAMAETQCGSGQIVVEVPAPLSRRVTACGQVLDYGLACGNGTCVWTQGAQSALMMQSEPGTAVIVLPDDGQSQVVVQEGASTDEDADVVQIDAAGTLQSLLASQLAAMRSCTQGATVTLQVRWTAEGQVSVALAPPHHGTPVEACVQQAFGALVLQGVNGGGALQVTL